MRDLEEHLDPLPLEEERRPDTLVTEFAARDDYYFNQSQMIFSFCGKDKHSTGRLQVPVVY